MAHQKIQTESRECKMQNNEPIPNYIKGEKEVKDVRGIKNARLQSCKEWNP
jgi:hypothetical protein